MSRCPARVAVAVLTLAIVLVAGPSSLAQAQDTLQAVCTSAGQTLPCGSGWYGSDVSVVWQANPPPTSTSGCLLGIEYAYTSDTETSLTCSALWSDGTYASYAFPLHVEVSTPTVQAIPSRGPDHGGWYTHPLTVGFSGSAFSGLAACTPPVSYAGPNSVAASMTGTCTDNAGKLASASFQLKYAATAPAVAVHPSPADREVGLHWVIDDVAPITSIRVTRTPGLSGHRSSVIYTGMASALGDRQVVDGVRYRYSIRVADQAGNTATRSIVVIPDPRLEAPPPGARLHSPPILSWTPVAGATYYNVQLFRSGKILSAWPRGARLRLKRTWRWDAHRYSLVPGRYRWFVWPGFGNPASARYGRAIGSSSFVIT